MREIVHVQVRGFVGDIGSNDSAIVVGRRSATVIGGIGGVCLGGCCIFIFKGV